MPGVIVARWCQTARIKIEMTVNCRRALRLYKQNPPDCKSSANEIIMIWNWTNESRGYYEICSGQIWNTRSAWHGGVIAVFTEMRNTPATASVHGRGAFICFGGGQIHERRALRVCLLSAWPLFNFPPPFYFVWMNFKNIVGLHCRNRRIWAHFTTTSLRQFYISVALAHKTFW
jgi:hypothetical protein